MASMWKRLAISIGVSRSWLRASGSAFQASRSFASQGTHLPRPGSITAKCNGVFDRASEAFTSAPALSNTCARVTATWGSRMVTAKCKGVSPPPAARPAAAPAAKASSASATSPTRQASSSLSVAAMRALLPSDLGAGLHGDISKFSLHALGELRGNFVAPARPSQFSASVALPDAHSRCCPSSPACAMGTKVQRVAPNILL
mmetsp:Transcript_118267/g.334244  ORF Transcript_118267/g.334244 Transcript_118267/m.334244 type:complete len:202 (-) Transcript_118267:29-634(-)